MVRVDQNQCNGQSFEHVKSADFVEEESYDHVKWDDYDEEDGCGEIGSVEASVIFLVVLAAVDELGDTEKEDDHA